MDSTAPKHVSGTSQDGGVIYRRIADNISRVIRGQPKAIRWLLAAMASGSHVLLEDYPGTGKTTLAKLLARSVDAEFQRVQFTPDLLPSDILGVSIYDQREQAFRFHKGPVFADILLADEINRASPRTQSALLEAMGEGQVSIDGTRYPLGGLFFVIATQNPIEFHGTYPLPEAQMDRFGMRFSLGYVDASEEVEILTEHGHSDPLDSIEANASREEVLSMRENAQAVRISDEMKRYIVELVAATRETDGVRMGCSPRASLSLMKITQALALFDGMEFVSPDHVQEVAAAVMAHRLALDPQARFSGLSADQAVRQVMEQVPVPT